MTVSSPLTPPGKNSSKSAAKDGSGSGGGGGGAEALPRCLDYSRAIKEDEGRARRFASRVGQHPDVRRLELTAEAILVVVLGFHHLDMHTAELGEARLGEGVAPVLARAKGEDRLTQRLGLLRLVYRRRRQLAAALEGSGGPCVLSENCSHSVEFTLVSAECQLMCGPAWGNML